MPVRAGQSLMQNLKPSTPMGWAMLIGVIVWLIDWTLSNNQTGALLGSARLKSFIDVASVLALIPLAYFLFSAARWVMRNLLWRLRQRLIVTYFLIGVLPLTLLLLLLVCIGLAVEMQSGPNRVARQLAGYLEQSQTAARAISRELRNAEARELRRELQERADALSAVFPGLMMRVARSDESVIEITGQTDSPEKVSSAAPTQTIPWESQPPAWLKDQMEFHGLVLDLDQRQRTTVFIRHLIRLQRRGFIEGNKPVAQIEPVVFEMRYPVGEALCAHLSHTTGLDVAPRTSETELSVRVSSQGTEISPGGQAGLPVTMPLARWQTGEQREAIALLVDPSFLHPGRIIERIQQARQASEVGNALFTVITGLAVIFLFIALLAVVSAAFLTRTITGAVHQLYLGTKRVEAGDLAHLIPTTGRDQLSELALSFNQMTRSVRELLRVSAEKQKLDQEMKIAAEVQSRLFPRAVPKSESLEISPGICIPARAVSGDYYDFLDIAPGVIGLVIADVCGKGMSAALLMSNLQASLRGQAQVYRDVYQEQWRVVAATAENSEAAISDELSPSRHRLSQIVGRVNRQIGNSTADARYVTMFYAEVDEAQSTLRYVNAGQNAPLLLRAEPIDEPVIERLDCGGTVLGLFSEVVYEEGEVKLRRGDVLVACTDGVIEAHNPQGEEFGEERLAEILAASADLSAIELERIILQAVRDWTGGADQEDDLTLVVVKKK
jgi:sigma-B regulation protein RsbU (phosphoserine phosphatase)